MSAESFKNRIARSVKGIAFAGAFAAFPAESLAAMPNAADALKVPTAEDTLKGSHSDACVTEGKSQIVIKELGQIPSGRFASQTEGGFTSARAAKAQELFVECNGLSQDAADVFTKAWSYMGTADFHATKAKQDVTEALGLSKDGVSVTVWPDRLQEGEEWLGMGGKRGGEDRVFMNVVTKDKAVGEAVWRVEVTFKDTNVTYQEADADACGNPFLKKTEALRVVPPPAQRQPEPQPQQNYYEDNNSDESYYETHDSGSSLLEILGAINIYINRGMDVPREYRPYMGQYREWCRHGRPEWRPNHNHRPPEHRPRQPHTNERHGGIAGESPFNPGAHTVPSGTPASMNRQSRTHENARYWDNNRIQQNRHNSFNGYDIPRNDMRRHTPRQDVGRQERRNNNNGRHGRRR